MKTKWNLKAIVVGCVLAGGCGVTPQAGLSNGPSINRRWNGDQLRYDPIANSTESCPPSGQKKDDALKNRRPKCPPDEDKEPAPQSSNRGPTAGPASAAPNPQSSR